ncbi:hypothetical protein [Colwellia sp. Arc7-D]|uniref:hypothetical protein n=1 Tax=Colwellia sp. Arc7-D TaxID=2161872 RepID=UPI000D3433B5|nr:hypothetical protein [Colwellia sp. Arc7-D]AWB57195.1 hypothetical protein DBO93_06315 [Colwellia sp. Arc7-D]
MNLDVKTFFNRYETDGFDDISESPGIYCWYAELKIEPVDWKYNDGSIIRALNESLQKHRANALTTSIKSNFGLKWEKTIHANENIRWVDQLESIFEEENEVHKFSALNNLLELDQNRELISTVLNEVSPLFNVPLYIGKAYNLQKRLKEHKRELDYYADSTPDNADQLFSNGESFVERAIGAGFAVEELVVYTLDLVSFVKERSISNVSNDDLKQVALLVEYVLNRRLRPSFGKI